MTVYQRCNLFSMILCLASAAGCSGDPPLYPISGKVTLGGKSHERLLVYFRPLQEPVTRFNLGVGETDKDGNLALRSSAGMGLPAGKYRVTFSCFVLPGASLGVDQKVDELAPGLQNLEPQQVVPELYRESAGDAKSPVEFEIRSGQNVFEFDIPTANAG